MPEMVAPRHVTDESATISHVSRAGRIRARKAAVTRMGQQGLNRKELATRAGISRNTVAAFLDGKSWPHESTLAQLDRGLGWKAGTLMGLGLTDEPGEERSPDLGAEPPVTSDDDQWLALLLTEEERSRLAPGEGSEIVAAGKAESRRRWREVEASRALRRGINAEGGSG